MYHIIDKQTGAVVGKAKTLRGARLSCDRRDNAYGCYNFRIVEVATGRIVL